MGQRNFKCARTQCSKFGSSVIINALLFTFLAFVLISAPSYYGFTPSRFAVNLLALVLQLVCYATKSADWVARNKPLNSLLPGYSNLLSKYALMV